VRILLFTFLIIFSKTPLSEPDLCTYSTYKWNTYSRQAVDFKQIQKPYSEITDEEIDKLTGCTVCQEDQVTVAISGLPDFKVCRYIAVDIQNALEKAISLGQLIVEVIGYRVGRTKGDIDDMGNRIQFSNHSFGTAIDINPEFNGLYDNCISYSSSCRLIKGGRWSNDKLESLHIDSHIVQTMKTIGFNWGGEIPGKQKDFMHFSLTGY